MRITLIFPPIASPTYAPLGLASLVSHLRRRAPGADIRARDLNLELWESLALADPDGPALLDFLRGSRGDFFDSASYDSWRPVWERLQGRAARLCADSASLLESGEAEAESVAWLDASSSSVLSSDPDQVWISCFSLDQVAAALALAARMRALTAEGRRPRVLLGGAATSFLDAAELLRACDGIDGVVLGEGEPAAEALALGRKDEEVPGLVHRSASGAVRNSPARTLSLRDMDPPDFSPLPLRRYFNPSPVLPLLFSRGCRWRRCRFCSHNVSFAGYRKKGCDAFAAEIERHVEGCGARHFYLADQYIEAGDLEAIARSILDRGLDIAWHTMARPAGTHGREGLELMAAAGCRWISWGVESGSQRLLDLINKSTRVDEIRRVLEDSWSAGISNLLMMIFGLPTSTDEDLQETFSFLDDVWHHVDALTASAFTLWERTDFARSASRYGLSSRGRTVLLRLGGIPLLSSRLDFREVAADGALRPPRGAHEVHRWQRRRLWMGPRSVLESLPAEHYLLFAARLATQRPTPRSPLPRAA
ncbi:MAG: radical SAM protein [Planctomycetes bacterium]|nr:radical SAM protein [Planctomycetota bacterium]